MSEPHEKRFRRADAAQYIREHHSQPCKPATLAKLACIGGGPEFEKAGRWPIYSAAALDAWAQARLSGPFRSTSEMKAAADRATTAEAA